MVTSMSRGRWWAYLLGTVLLAVVALGWPLARGWRAYAQRHPVRAITVPAGGDARYADARWRMLSFAADAAPTAGNSARGLPPETVLVRARFTVVPGSGTDLKQLANCRARVRDAAGRRWDSYGRRGALPNNCGSGYDANARPITAQVGQPWTFEVGFVVPRAVADRVEPELIVPKQFPEYLHFTR